MISIIILGMLNVIYSDNPPKSRLAMERLLLTGVLATWVSMFLINNQQRRNIFNWFCCGCMAIIILFEFIAYTPPTGPLHYNGLANIFTLHSIPLGTLLILLSMGPLHLILSKNRPIRTAGYLVAGLGGILIFLSQKRGTFLAIAAMVLIWGLYRSVRVRYLAAGALLAILLLIPLKGGGILKSLNPDIPSQASILQRFELYPFALHVWKQHPMLGIGLRSLTHDKYLETYNQDNKHLNSFSYSVKKLQTFDNMFVTSFVELGTLMTLVYFWLIILIFIKYWQKLRSYQQPPREDFYRLLVLLGFAIHSMTYDSLVFPPINWLFHVNLGIMAAYNTTDEPLNQ